MSNDCGTDYYEGVCVCHTPCKPNIEHRNVFLGNGRMEWMILVGDSKRV